MTERFDERILRGLVALEAALLEERLREQRRAHAWVLARWCAVVLLVGGAATMVVPWVGR